MQATNVNPDELSITKRKSCRVKHCPAENNPCLWSGEGDKPAHLIIIADRPTWPSIGKRKAFSGATGMLFRKLLRPVREYQNGKYKDLKVYNTYAVLAGVVEPSAQHIQHCRHRLLNEIASVQGVDGREPVIISLGLTPLKALGVALEQKKINDIAGRVLSYNLEVGGRVRKFNVIPIFTIKHINAKPGLASVVNAALLQAAKLATGDKKANAIPLEVLTKDYIFPTTLEGVREVIDQASDYYDPEKSSGPGGWLISVDTETNTLHPSSHADPKTLMVSLSWDQGKAATILLDHDEVPYDPKAAWEIVKRLLESPKPKGFHNWKYDRKFLQIVYGCRVHRVVWDTMLGEHFLDEDKKGLYSLKKLVTIYAPEYTGYDDELHKILRGGEAEPGMLYLAEKDVLDNVLAPEGRDQILWEDLALAVDQKLLEKAKPKNLRDSVIMKKLTKVINDFYKKLDMKKPKRAPKKKKASGFEGIPLDTILQYAGVDSDVTRIIAKLQIHRINGAGTYDDAQNVMRQLYLPGSSAMSDMEFEGFGVDAEHMDYLDGNISKTMHDREKNLRENFDPNTNYRSPAQISSLMTRMNFETLPGTVSGSTNKETLDAYVKHYDDADSRCEFSKVLLEFRAADKAKNGFLRKIRRLSDLDGKIHCNFNLNGTATGRLSSSEPNMQNIPKMMCQIIRDKKVLHPGYNIKKLFVPSVPGNVIVNCDIKGAELRVYTAYSDDADMIDALRKGLDVHSFTAGKINNIPYEEVIRRKKANDAVIIDLRDIAKRVVFGTFYGAGAYKIAEQIGGTKAEAQKVIDLLFEAFPALREYITQTREQVQRYGVVRTHFGRYRRFRLAHASRKHMAEAVREAVNFLIQSTASDLVLSQLCEVHDHLREVDAKMLITVHDSMVFEMPEHNVPKLFDFLDHWVVDRVREKYAWLPVPFAYDLEVGPSYGELKEVYRQ